MRRGGMSGKTYVSRETRCISLGNALPVVVICPVARELWGQHKRRNTHAKDYFAGPLQRAVPIAKYRLLQGGWRRPAYQSRKLPSGKRKSVWLVVKFDSQS